MAQAEDDYGGPPPGLSEDERNELNKPDLNVNELRRMAEEHLQAKIAVEEVPEVLDVGAYRVSCQNVRRLLADKHQETATKLLDLVARKTGDNALDASGEFQKIMDRSRSRRPLTVPSLPYVHLRERWPGWFIETRPFGPRRGRRGASEGWRSRLDRHETTVRRARARVYGPLPNTMLHVIVVAAMASTRCRTASTPSMRPHESRRA